MRDERLAGDLQHRLRHGLGKRAQPRCKPAGEQRNGRHLGHGHTMVLVPSKSKRKRTSLRPAVIIAWRNRVLSSAENIRKPPPPGPISFPPGAPVFIA